MSNAATQKEQGLALRKKADGFMAEVTKRQQSFARLLPKGLDPEWFVGEVRVAVVRAPNLMNCDPTSVFDALTTCAQLGLSPSGRLGSAYLIPYGTRCTLVVGYKGLIDLAYRSGEVVGFGAQVVHENEPFEVTEGFDITIHKHDRDVENPGRLRAVYAWAELRGGYKVKTLMWAREVLAIKAKAPGASKSDSPWQTHEPEQWKKTALRRLSKMLPLSPQKAAGLTRALEAEDAQWEDIPMDVGTDEAPALTSGNERLKADLKTRRKQEAPAEDAVTEPLPMSHPLAEPPPEPGTEG